MSSTQLHDEIERSFGDGPQHPPVATRLEAGHRALRRRRSVTAALAVVVLLGVGYAVSGPGPSGRSTGEQFATDPTPTATTSAPYGSWEASDPVRNRDGVLVVRPGAVVHERIDNPYERVAPDSSVALDLTIEGRRTWVVAEIKGDDLFYTASVPNDHWATFGDWVADEIDLTTGGGDGWPDTLVLDDQGAVVASPGSEVLQRTDDPRLGAVFARPGEPTGAAVVRAAEDGRSYFVIWRVIDGRLDVFTVPPADVVGATFQELLSYVRGKIARQEGLQ